MEEIKKHQNSIAQNKKLKKKKMPLVYCSNIKARIEDFTNVYIAAND